MVVIIFLIALLYWGELVNLELGNDKDNLLKYVTEK